MQQEKPVTLRVKTDLLFGNKVYCEGHVIENVPFNRAANIIKSGRAELVPAVAGTDLDIDPFQEPEDEEVSKEPGKETASAPKSKETATMPPVKGNGKPTPPKVD